MKIFGVRSNELTVGLTPQHFLVHPETKDTVLYAKKTEAHKEYMEKLGIYFGDSEGKLFIIFLGRTSSDKLIQLAKAEQEITGSENLAFRPLCNGELDQDDNMTPRPLDEEATRAMVLVTLGQNQRLTTTYWRESWEQKREAVRREYPALLIEALSEPPRCAGIDVLPLVSQRLALFVMHRGSSFRIEEQEGRRTTQYIWRWPDWRWPKLELVAPRPPRNQS